MPRKKCCVPQCKSTQLDSCLHTFPNPEKDPQRYRLWTNAIGGEFLFMDPKTAFKLYKVCHSHFEEKFQTHNARLTANAIPTLHVRGYSNPARWVSMNPTSPTSIATSHIPDVPSPTPSTSNLDSLNSVAHPGHSNPARWVSINPTSSTSIGTSHIPSVPSPTSSTPNLDSLNSLANPGHTYSSRKPLQDITNTDSNKNVTFKGVKPESRFPAAHLSNDLQALENKIKKLQKKNYTFKIKLKKAMNLVENKAFINTLKKFTSLATIFTLLQFREIKKDKMGRRFTKEEKIMSLALLKQGPKAYRFLRKLFVLPSPITLIRMITKANLKPGLNENIFMALKKRVDKMNNKEKLCVLLFDEMAITPHYDYNKRTDSITGFVNDGKKVKKEIADHALVFMLRGLQKNFKQPLAYTFCRNSTPKLELQMLIKEIIKKLHSIGLKVVATVCDQGTNNVSAINYLIEETRKKYLRRNADLKNNTFEVDGEEIIPLYDPPHLIKGVRNNLLTKDLICKIDGTPKVAKWQHLIKLYKEDPAYQGIRLMPKLTDYHILPNKIGKMKVKYATQIFSRTVAAYMGYLASIGKLPNECQETADVLLFFDSLFDSVNGSFEKFTKHHGKPLLGPVTPKSAHKKTWEQSKTVLKSMSFQCNGKKVMVPSIKNWIHTIENIEYLTKTLNEKYDLSSVWLRHLNQDPLENFFGSIRSHGCRNNSPTCASFSAAFSSLLINKISNIHSAGSNCEEDSCFVFTSLSEIFFKESLDLKPTITEIEYNHINHTNISIDLEEKIRNPIVKVQLEYVTGFLLKKLNVSKCKTCTQCLSLTDIDQSSIRFREFLSNKSWLKYPSENLVRCFSQIQDIVNLIILDNPEIKNIKLYIKTILSIIMDYSFIHCKIHKEDLTKKIEDITIDFFLFNWCKDTNKILCGSRSNLNENDVLQIKALDYYKVKQNKRRK